jgi:hypothetical protein
LNRRDAKTAKKNKIWIETHHFVTASLHHFFSAVSRASHFVRHRFHERS